MALTKITKEEAIAYSSLGIPVKVMWGKDDAHPTYVTKAGWYYSGPDRPDEPWLYYVETE